MAKKAEAKAKAIAWHQIMCSLALAYQQ